MTDKPAVSAWHQAMGLSTSAILRRTQDELAEARGQLAGAEAERDVARKLGKTLSDQHHGVLRELAEARAEAKEFRARAELYLRQRDDALHDLAHARFEVTKLRALLGTPDPTPTKES